MHEGDGYPYTQIRNGLPDIPSQMATEATTRETENARLVGTVVSHMTFGPWNQYALDLLWMWWIIPASTGATLWGLAPLAAILTGWARWGGLC